MATFVSNEQLIAIQKAQISSLKSQLADTQKRLDEELNKNFEKSDNQILKLMTKNKALKSQLASVKYLNAGEVKRILGRYIINSYYEDYVDEDDIVQAICNLAIPEDDFLDKLNDYIKTNPDKVINQIIANVGVNNYKKNIIKILHEFVKYQIEADNLINNEAVEYVADEIIKALEGK